MNNERITLTMKEQRINDILVKLISDEIKTSDAVRLTGLSERQIYRKKKAYKEYGIASIPHQNKNKSKMKDIKIISIQLLIEYINKSQFY